MESPDKEPSITQPKSRQSWLGLLALLLKSGKVIKLLLAGAAFSGWSVIYNWKFALILIAVIMFHEYGHLRAMRKFGIPTKGMYLIPFFGGVAIGGQARSHWAEVYISMMGPVYGLFMSLVFYGAYLATGNQFVGLIASISALINIINLLPVYPLDGGRVMKALVFSSKKYWGFALLLATSAFFFAFSMASGLALLSLFIVIGLVDLLFSWKDHSRDQKTALTPYGILFSLIWYVATIAVFLTTIYLIAASELPGSELAIQILKS